MGLENQGSIRDLNCMLSDNLAVECHNTTIYKKSPCETGLAA